MLRSIFPDEPGDDGVALADADTPSAYFAEFLPKGIQVRQAVSDFVTSFSAAPKQAGAAADSCSPAQDGPPSLLQPQQQQQQQRGAKAPEHAQGSSNAQPSQQTSRQKAIAAGAAANAAKASAATAATAAAAVAASSAKQAEAADKEEAAQQLKAKVNHAAAATTGAAAAQSEAAADTDDRDLLPSLSEIRSAMAAAWFGDENGEDGDVDSSSKERGTHSGVHKNGEEEEEPSMFERLMPFGKDANYMPSFVPSFTRRRRTAKPKPLRLKLAEQVLPKEVLNAVQTVEQEILSAPDPLPAAIINFFLRAGRSMGTDWARKNANKVFAGFAAYVAATCGAMHGLKAAAKWLAWRIPRFGPRAGPAVSFIADVLLPTPFFGPFVATYVLVMLVVAKQPEGKPKDEEAAKAVAEGTAAATTAATAAGTAAKQQLQQQPSRSRSLELEFLMQEPVRPAPHRRLLRSRRSITRTGSITRARAHAAAAAAAAAGSR